MNRRGFLAGVLGAFTVPLAGAIPPVQSLSGFVPLRIGTTDMQIGRWEGMRFIPSGVNWHTNWLHPGQAARKLLASSPARRRWVLAHRYWRADGKPLLTPQQIYRSYREPSKALYGHTL